MKNIKILLLVVIFIAFFSRFYQLGENPPLLTWDETSWGYNAYSLGIDGKDEFGKFLPFTYLESFGDFKPPVYAYLDILPIKFFGLNELAVRFPSALFGVLTVIITYFLVKRVFWKNEKISPELVAILASFFLAISPWHINLSRAAFEANVATFFLVSGVWLFLGGVQNKKWYLPFSIIFFVLSIYTFNTSRIVAPLLVLGLMLGFAKKLVERKKQVVIAVAIGLLMVLPIFKFLLSPQATLRFKEVNIFSDISVIEKINQEIANDGNTSWSKVLHNRRFIFSLEFIRHYFDNLNPYFLFIKGDGNPKFSTQDVGEMYIWDLPFFVIGILFIFKLRQKGWWVLLFWIIVGIIPAATARETPHALRIETTLPVFQVFTAVGVAWFLGMFKQVKMKKYTKNIILTVIFLILFFNSIYYYHGYYSHYPREFSGEWQYGYKDSIAYVSKIQGEYDQVDITDSLGRPYIYYLFYTKTDPNTFRETATIKREVLGFVTVEGFSKYRFAGDLKKIENKDKRVLYVDTLLRTPGNAKILKTFELLNGEKSLAVYTL